MFKNAEMLQGAENDLGVFGKMPGPRAQKELADNPNFYKQPGQTEAMTNIGQSGDTAPKMTWPYATIAGGEAAVISGILSSAGRLGRLLTPAGSSTLPPRRAARSITPIQP